MIKNKKICYGSFILIAFVYLILFSFSTSPLHPNYFSDYGGIYSSSKLLIGKGISKGLLPYKDLLGVDGPILYIFESIGWFFGNGKLGIFLIQLICLSLVLIFTYKTLTLFISEKTAYIFSCAMMIFIFATYAIGNNEEEFCLAFTIIGVYIGFKYLKNLEKNNKSVFSSNRCETLDAKLGFALGICFGLVLMIRMNDIFPLVGILLGLVVFMKKDDLFKVLISILIGVVVIVVPCFVYYYLKGGLGDMIYGAFLYNIKYMATGFADKNILIRKIIKSLPCLFLIFYSIIYSMKKNKAVGITACLFAIFSLLSIVSGDVDWHYFIIQVPYVFIGSAMLLDCESRGFYKILAGLGLVMALVIIVSPLKSYVTEVYDVYKNQDYKEENKFMADLNENYLKGKNSVTLVDVPSSFYFVNDTMPENRLFTEQTVMAKVDYSISKEIQNYIYKTPTDNLIISSNGWIFEVYGEYSLIQVEQNSNGKNFAVYKIGESGNHNH